MHDNNNLTTESPTQTEPKKSGRDWFGYIFTTCIGIAVTILVAWYQLYATQNEAAAAELERARAVKQSAVSIVEEHVLNNKNLEIDRLTRIIEQRRRDQKIVIPISVSEVVEQAEFNIESSHHLSIDRKEEIKPIFDKFYNELYSRSFQPISSTSPNSDILNEIAKLIQSGKNTEALSALKRLEDAQIKELSAAKAYGQIKIFDAFSEIFSSPFKTSLLIALMILYIWVANRILRKWLILKRKQNYFRRHL